MPRAEKSSDEVGERQCTQQRPDGHPTGAVFENKKKRKQEREEIIREALGKDLILEIPDKQSLAMKADLGMSWFRLNKLRRYLVHVLILININPIYHTF